MVSILPSLVRALLWFDFGNYKNLFPNEMDFHLFTLFISLLSSLSVINYFPICLCFLLYFLVVYLLTYFLTYFSPSLLYILIYQLLIDWFLYSLSCAVFLEMLLWSWLIFCFHSLDVWRVLEVFPLMLCLALVVQSLLWKNIFPDILLPLFLTADSKLVWELFLGVIGKENGLNLFTG